MLPLQWAWGLIPGWWTEIPHAVWSKKIKNTPPKLLKDNAEENLDDLGSGDDLLDTTPKA